MRDRRRGRRGSMIVELALAVPLISTLTLGMVEFSTWYNVKNLMGAAAREGVRAGVPWNSSIAKINAAVAEQLTVAGLAGQGQNYTVTVTNSGGTPINDLSTLASGSTFKVTVSVNWSSVSSTFKPLQLIGPARVVSTSCAMRKEF